MPAVCEMESKGFPTVAQIFAMLERGELTADQAADALAIRRRGLSAWGRMKRIIEKGRRTVIAHVP